MAEAAESFADAVVRVEDETGIRAPWRVWPQMRHDSTKLGVPLSLVYTPLKAVANPYRASYAPVRCSGCSAVLSPFTYVDYQKKSYVCSFCSLMQPLPPSYAQITPEYRPAELHDVYKTIEYNLSATQAAAGGHATPQVAPDYAPIFAIVVDTCCEDAEQFAKMKESLQWIVDVLPSNSKICLVSFGSVVTVHELVFDFCPRKVVLRGLVDIPPAQLEQYLGLKTTTQRFLQPLSLCQNSLVQILEDLMKDPWVPPPKCRPHRCLGAALSIATSILQSLSLPAGIPITMDTTNATAVRPTTGFAGRVVLLTSGPCTAGPGTVVDIDLSMHLRHWPDIEKKTDVAKHVKDAQRFYTSLGERAATNGISYHVFSCSVEQVGLYEMYQMVSMTGGHMMISESYSYQAFVRSWRCFFDQLVQAARQEETETTGRGEINEDEEEGDEPELVPLQFGSRAIIEASIGSGGKITGCVGHVVPLPPTVSTKGSQQAPTCSNPAFVAGTFYEGGSKVLSLGGQDNEIGHGFTNRWLASHIDSESTFCFCYEANHDPKNAMALTLPAYIPVQFRTLYIDNVTGDQILRVTTYVFQGANPLSDWAKISSEFDQEAAAVVLAKITMFNLMHRPGITTDEVMRYIDRSIIKLSQAFSSYQLQNAATLVFQPNFEFFPQFLYHFRRSEFIQLFGQSPDETAMKRFQLLRQTTANVLTMMQPVLYAYTVTNPEPTPVFLDSSEATQDRILLFDSFFNVLVWTGSSVAAWRKAEYHLKPEYANVATLLDAPNYEVEDILNERFPSPRYDNADQGTSQARILLARVNPTTTHKSNQTLGGFTLGNGGQPEAVGEVVATDDVSLQKFLAALKESVVQQGK
ncbi:Sec23 [Giardia duodenalis]|uniref:Protein transport protein SEC23 n=1 Tax=Giardia intestinalis (strain ATCC 50803 / WB clone C6) TaxID=184922 RepID=A8B8F4_GIAIC|nr:Sec23 [Giardia intestinalis]KAE8302458.1 Sec23 [Giardia intestinalis]|eukprot:XP_001708605.1 Sec23 [Giardia lamblia ATCC 50803]